MSSGTKAALVVLYVLVIAPFGVWWGGYALSLMWGWLIVPTWGAPAITTIQAIAASFVFSYLLQIANLARHEDKGKDFSVVYVGAVVRVLLAPLLGLGVAAIIRLFI